MSSTIISDLDIRLAGRAKYACRMVPRIGAKRPYRIFAREWIDSTRLDDKVIAERMECSAATLSKLLNGKMQWTEGYLAALAHAVDTEVPNLYRHPDQPSPDDLLRAVPEARRNDIIQMIRALTKAG